MKLQAMNKRASSTQDENEYGCKALQYDTNCIRKKLKILIYVLVLCILSFPLLNLQSDALQIKEHENEPITMMHGRELK